MTQDEKIRAFVENLVRSMPPELIEKMAELKKEGRLEEVVNKAIFSTRLNHAAAQYFSRLTRNEIVTPFRSAAKSFRFKPGVYRSVLTAGGRNVRRISAVKSHLAGAFR